ncbi:lipase family protein [Streptomyces daliensis]|uniref:Lipase n=1 Tax=Streptomyces daliensis TaxID=299421 RepID=A0A8T4ITV4_9ACTN|nr:hypothetical protein [Streptomyces daliensis]
MRYRHSPTSPARAHPLAGGSASGTGSRGGVTLPLLVLLSALAVLAALLVWTPTASASHTQDPAQSQAAAGSADDDAFYTPPEPLPQGEPGDVIRSRPAKAGPPGAVALADAWQVMYLSTDAQGAPTAVTGTVLVPKAADPAQAPVVGFAPGTHGPAFRCAPSRMIDGGAFYEQPALNDLLRSGYAVAVTDYEGYRPEPRTTYVVGRSMGPALVDAVRAAQRLPEARLSADAKVLFRGYSQGGGAAMWAAQTQPAYAPELNLVGVAAGGVPADLTQVALPLDGKSGFGVLAYALIGLDHAYPELKLDSYFNEAGRAAFAAMEESACTVELLVDYAGKRTSDYLERSPFLDPPWLQRVAENKLGESSQGIHVPVFQYHAAQDELVAYSQADRLHQRLCERGVPLTWKTYEMGHLSLVYRGNADVLAFLKDRVAGKPAAPTC